MRGLKENKAGRVEPFAARNLMVIVLGAILAYE
jgi:hypothetical protein